MKSEKIVQEKEILNELLEEQLLVTGTEEIDDKIDDHDGEQHEKESGKETKRKTLEADGSEDPNI